MKRLGAGARTISTRTSTRTRPGAFQGNSPDGSATSSKGIC
jgi:hypothetical protein